MGKPGSERPGHHRGELCVRAPAQRVHHDAAMLRDTFQDWVARARRHVLLGWFPPRSACWVRRGPEVDGYDGQAYGIDRSVTRRIYRHRRHETVGGRLRRPLGPLRCGCLRGHAAALLCVVFVGVRGPKPRQRPHLRHLQAIGAPPEAVDPVRDPPVQHETAAPLDRGGRGLALAGGRLAKPADRASYGAVMRANDDVSGRSEKTAGSDGANDDVREEKGSADVQEGQPGT